MATKPRVSTDFSKVPNPCPCGGELRLSTISTTEVPTPPPAPEKPAGAVKASRSARAAEQPPPVMPAAPKAPPAVYTFLCACGSKWEATGPELKTGLETAKLRPAS